MRTAIWAIGAICLAALLVTVCVLLYVGIAAYGLGFDNEITSLDGSSPTWPFTVVTLGVYVFLPSLVIVTVLVVIEAVRTAVRKPLRRS